jgi:hypothetical protein
MPSEYATGHLGQHHSRKNNSIPPTNIPSLRKKYSQEEEQEQGTSAHPSERSVWSRLVKPCLILLSMKPSSVSILECDVYTIDAKSSLQKKSHTRWNLEVCAVRAAKGVCSGSIESMVPLQAKYAQKSQ